MQKNSEILIRKFSVLLLLFFVFSSVLFLTPIRADASISETWAALRAGAACSCFCQGTTIVDKGQHADDAACSAACGADGLNMNVCASEYSEFPGNQPQCFTQEVCVSEKYNGEWDTRGTAECPSTHRYCYSKEHVGSTRLNVPIGDLVSTTDIGEYIAVTYRFMISAGALIAIVLIMLAGVRWTLSAGSGDISKAKKMIRDAVYGLVLLLCAYLIIYTINPELVRLQPPQIPMIRTINLLDDASCEELAEEGYELARMNDTTITSLSSYSCGDTAKVVKDSNGVAVAAGTVCPFKSCHDHRDLCLGSDPTCISCHEVTINNSVVAPSKEVCGAFEALPAHQKYFDEITYQSNLLDTMFDATIAPTYKTESRLKEYHQCFFTKDGDAVGGGTPFSKGTCAVMELNCNVVTECSDYDQVIVSLDGSSTTLDKIDKGIGHSYSEAPSAIRGSLTRMGDLTLTSMCINDMFYCEWNRDEYREHGIEAHCYVNFLSPGAIINAEFISPIGYGCKDT